MRQVNERELIHCIGDSHVGLFSGFDYLQRSLPHPSKDRLPQFRVHRVGPGLAYNLPKENTTTRSRERMIEVLHTLPRASKVMLCFGEVDCRSHLIKHAQTSGKSWEDVAKNCAERYLDGAEIVQKMGFELWIFNAIPSSRYTKPGNEYPTLGNCKERNQITAIFNKAVEEGCKKRRLIFIHNFPKLVTSSLLTKSIYYFDKVHLSQRALPLTLRSIKEAVSEFSFIEPKNYKWSLFKSWLRLVFVEKKRIFR